MKKDGNYLNLGEFASWLVSVVELFFCVYTRSELLRAISLMLLFLFSTISTFAQNDTLPLSTKGGKSPISSTSNLPTLVKTDTIPKGTLLPHKKWELPPTTEAAQRWEKKAYRRVLQELPKPISAILTPLDSNHQDPNVAYKRALILPGWGQAYNRSYWKIPIVYAGLGGLGYWFYYNNQQYKIYQTAYRYATDGDSTTNPLFVPNVKAQQVEQGYRALRDGYRRTRDQSVIFIAGFYALQVVEAYVNAHLKYFDVEENLSMQVAPTLMQTSASTVPRAGIGVNFRF